MSTEYAEWVRPGLVIAGAGIAPGTLIASVNSATQITLTNNATATAAGVTLYIVRPNDPISAAVAFHGWCHQQWLGHRECDRCQPT